MRHLLVASRFLLILPVIGSLLLMVGVVVMGLGVVLTQGWHLMQQGEFSPKGAEQLTLTVIESIDMFLVGAISYIVAVGLYKLFISQDEQQILKRVKIEKLADLENKIIGVVVVAMAVVFLVKPPKQSMLWRYCKVEPEWLSSLVPCVCFSGSPQRQKNRVAHLTGQPPSLTCQAETGFSIAISTATTWDAGNTIVG